MILVAVYSAVRELGIGLQLDILPGLQHGNLLCLNHQLVAGLNLYVVGAGYFLPPRPVLVAGKPYPRMRLSCLTHIQAMPVCIP